jgi:phosphotransacetylase
MPRNTGTAKAAQARNRARIAETAKQLVELIEERGVTLSQVQYLTISRNYIGAVFVDQSEWPDIVCWRGDVR